MASERLVCDPQVRGRLRIARLDPAFARPGLVGRGQSLRDNALEREQAAYICRFRKCIGFGLHQSGRERRSPSRKDGRRATGLRFFSWGSLQRPGASLPFCTTLVRTTSRRESRCGIGTGA
jgi:hypothetical protein